MEREACEVMSEALAVNAVELEEYSSVTEMTTRCIAMLAHLFNLPPDVAPTGAATVGSTEAAMLALLALKARKRMTGADFAHGADADACCPHALADALAAAAPPGGQARHQAEPGHGAQRAGGAGEVLPVRSSMMR